MRRVKYRRRGRRSRVVGEQVPGDDQDAVPDGEHGPVLAFLAERAQQVPVLRGEVGPGRAGGPGALGEHAASPVLPLRVRPSGACRRTRCCPGTARPRRPGAPRWGTGSCPRRSCDARSHVTSELMDRRSDGVGRVAPGECSMPVPRPGVRRRSCLLGCEARGRAQGPLIHPGDHQARGKAGRVNASKPLMTPRN